MTSCGFGRTDSFVIIALNKNRNFGKFSITGFDKEIIVRFSIKNSFGCTLFEEIKAETWKSNHILISYITLKKLLIDGGDLFNGSINIVFNWNYVHLILDSCCVNTNFRWSIYSNWICKYSTKLVYWSILNYFYNEDFELEDKLDSKLQKKLFVEYSARAHIFINILHGCAKFNCSHPIFTLFKYFLTYYSAR